MATNPDMYFSDKVADFVRKQLTKPPKERRGVFSPSALGGCSRAQVFRFTKIETKKTINTDLQNIFMTGHFMHLKWQCLLLQAGIIEDAEVEVRHAKRNLMGTMDGIGIIPQSKLDAFPEVYDVPYKPAIMAGHKWRSQRDKKYFGLEIKSINGRNFDFLLRNNAPNLSHIYQVHVYMAASGLSVFSVVYENKDSGEWKEFTVVRDPQILRDVEAKLGALQNYVDTRTLPTILEPCQSHTGPYRSCPFASQCLTMTEDQVIWLEDQSDSQESQDNS